MLHEQPRVNIHVKQVLILLLVWKKSENLNRIHVAYQTQNVETMRLTEEKHPGPLEKLAELQKQQKTRLRFRSSLIRHRSLKSSSGGIMGLFCLMAAVKEFEDLRLGLQPPTVQHFVVKMDELALKRRGRELEKEK